VHGKRSLKPMSHRPDAGRGRNRRVAERRMGFALCSLKCSSSSNRGKSPSVCLRNAREEDLDRLVQIDFQCFPGGFWSRTAFMDEIRMPLGQSCLVVAENLAPEVVGVGCLRQVLDEGSITYLAVSGCSRRRGIGSMVVADLIARCSARGIKIVTLEVRYHIYNI